MACVDSVAVEAAVEVEVVVEVEPVGVDAFKVVIAVDDLAKVNSIETGATVSGSPDPAACCVTTSVTISVTTLSLSSHVPNLF